MGQDTDGQAPRRLMSLRFLWLVPLAGFMLLLAVSDQSWVARSDLPSWYFSPAKLMPDDMLDGIAGALCEHALGRSCIKAAVAGQNLRCWTAGNLSWCVDQTATTATALWMASIAMVVIVLILGKRAARRSQTAAGRGTLPAASGHRDPWESLIFCLLLIVVTMLNADSDLRKTQSVNLAGEACSRSSPDCIFELANRIPTVAATVVVAFFMLALVGFKFYELCRRDVTSRTATNRVSES